MNENQIRQLIQQEIGKSQQQARYSTTNASFHTHNGIDSPPISSSSSSASLASGTIVGFGGTSAPTGWLICDGSAVSRTTYAALFTAISTLYGHGDGSTTFNLPDGRTQVMAGYKSGDATFGTFGNVSVGEVTHTLTTTEMPSHQHGLTGSNSGSYAYGPSAFSVWSSTTYAQTALTGGGGAHNNVQPTFVANYIIKT